MPQLSGMLDNGAQPAHVMAGGHGASGTSDVYSDALPSPGRVFSHPAEVVRHPGLTREEKRAILASWASDACAVEDAPALRRLPGASEPVWVDDVLAALRALDPDPDEGTEPQARRRSRVLWRNPKLSACAGAFGHRPGLQSSVKNFQASDDIVVLGLGAYQYLPV